MEGVSGGGGLVHCYLFWFGGQGGQGGHGVLGLALGNMYVLIFV